MEMLMSILKYNERPSKKKRVTTEKLCSPFLLFPVA